MSGRRINSRQKGKRRELEASKRLTELGVESRRTQQFSGSEGTSDVVSADPYDWIHWEVKSGRRIRLYDAIDQAQTDAKDEKMPVVLHRADRKGWLVTIALEDFVYLLQEGMKAHG
jgi:Holliday junction resolvase